MERGSLDTALGLVSPIGLMKAIPHSTYSLLGSPEAPNSPHRSDMEHEPLTLGFGFHCRARYLKMSQCSTQLIDIQVLI